MDHQRILDEISKTSIHLMLKETFYGHFFTGILKDVSEKTRSIATNIANKQTIQLIVNPQYWDQNLNVPFNEQKTKEIRYGAIKHQILHIVFKHALRYNDFGDKKIFSIAADLTVNQYIEDHQLGDQAIKIDDFKDFSLQGGQGIDYYYQKLKDALSDMNDDSKGNAAGQNPMNESEQKLDELMRQTDNDQLEQHKFWDEFQELSSAEQKMIEANINESIMNTLSRIKSRDFGKLPGGLQNYIQLLMESLKPNLNWRRILRIFTASSSRTQLKNTIRKPSKRYGTTPGIKIRCKQKLLLVLDTSGSVNEDELKEFFSEIYHIWKQGAEVYILECDTIINKQYLYKGKVPEMIHGRGGTCFDEPIKFANEKYQPDATIYFTDGFAPEPTVKSRKPILWMITPKGIEEENWDYLPGRKVKMITQLN